MKSYLSLLALLAIAFASQAEDTGMVPQIYNAPNPAVVESSNTTSARKNSDLCQNLHKEMESLKGRPLRRNAVAQRYDLECRQRRP
jgi:hypothetical protein